MITLFLEVTLPIVVLLIGFVVIRSYRRIDSPSPLALGCIMPKVCVVGSVEILHFNKKNLDEQLKVKHLRREVLWNQFKVNWRCLCQETWDTTLFQRAVRFEKINLTPPNPLWNTAARNTHLRSGHEADRDEIDAFSSQATLLMRAVFRLTLTKRCSYLCRLLRKA